MPFWSSEGRAQNLISTVTAYADFQPAQLELSAFIERWLPGLERDGLLAGLNWAGERATGYDLQPKDVLARLAAVKL